MGGAEPVLLETGIVLSGQMLKSSRMFLVRTGGVSFLFVLLLVAAGSPALASCTDPPTPGVNWQRCAMDGLDLKEVNLAGARLRDSSFFRADLTGSDLSGTESFKAKFVNAVLQDTVFDGAQLYEADLTKADLTGASLVGTDLRRARLYRANLRDANLTDARLEGADLARANLSGATWTDGERVCAEGSIGRCN
jgi:uncharacterized protein YjbI with pentapeptide repeats